MVQIIAIIFLILGLSSLNFFHYNPRPTRFSSIWLVHRLFSDIFCVYCQIGLKKIKKIVNYRNIKTKEGKYLKYKTKQKKVNIWSIKQKNRASSNEKISMNLR